MKGQLHKLSALGVSKIVKPGDYGDGGGLYLQVTLGKREGVMKSWIFRYVRGKKDTKLGLGSLNTISLSDAREKAMEFRQLLHDGIDPKVHREQQKIQEQLEKSNRKTFRHCAEMYIDDNKAAWKNAKHAAQWASSLENYAHRVIGDVVVAEISTPMILEILRPIWTEKVETANRLRGRIETILSWAKVQGYRTGDNPAEWKGHLDQILPARTKIKKTVHHAAMPYKEIPAYFKTLHGIEGSGAFALEFAILNASRAGEILNATWMEIDFEEKLWIIPASRMKAAREHRIPLTDEAIELLHKLPGYTLDKELRDECYLFPSSSNRKALSNMAMTAVLRRTGKGEFTQHGFRSAFRDWAAEVVHYPREVIEHALAHKLADEVEAAYQRGDLLDKRRQLMKDWSAYCCLLLKNN